MFSTIVKVIGTVALIVVFLIHAWFLRHVDAAASPLAVRGFTFILCCVATGLVAIWVESV